MAKLKPAPQNAERAFEHFKALHHDIRDEIKYRIKQRDTYSIQMTLTLGALVGVAATSIATQFPSTARALVAAPLISIYYTTLILYSYRIHRLLSKYLREVIEPELARLCDVPINLEWENWYTKNEVPGIRRSFFLRSLWAITILSPLYVAFSEQLHGPFIVPLGIISVIYILVTIWITKSFRHG